jgi:hypothetical protein
MANIYIAVVGVESVLVYKMAQDDLAAVIDARSWVAAVRELMAKSAVSRVKKGGLSSSTSSTAVSHVDGVTSKHEMVVIALVDQVAMVAMPISFSWQTWRIFRDDSSHAILVTMLTLAAIRVVAGVVTLHLSRHPASTNSSGDGGTARGTGTGSKSNRVAVLGPSVGAMGATDSHAEDQFAPKKGAAAAPITAPGPAGS